MSINQPSFAIESVDAKTHDQMLEKLRDPHYLPERHELYEAFEDVPDMKEAWDDFCGEENHKVYEFLNQEFMDALADYLDMRTVLSAPHEKVTILELGAGDGRLAHFLQEKLEEREPGKFRVVASDSGAWKIKPAFAVENIKNTEALEKYNPDIVICSWMPPRVDFTKDIRACKNVKEYLLIGEAYGGSTGRLWETWGEPVTEEQDEEVPPYKADGFRDVVVEEVSKEQVCKIDEPSAEHEGHSYSQTISFRRQK